MQFIGTGDRILTENFNVGYLYTITFKTGIYINSACIGIGDTFVMFQKAEPDLLFTLNVDTADEVDTIELYDSGGGTNNYDDLVNRPQINSHTLTGNMSGADLGLQNTISDIDTIRAGAAAGATAVQPAALSDYQPKIDSTHMLSADLVDDTSTTHKFATQTQLDQIGINENNILSTCCVGTCTTSGNVAAKIVTIDDANWTLRKGCIIAVKFSNSNSVSDTESTPITLNVNNTGAYRIWYKNGAYANASQGKVFGYAGYYIYYMFDGVDRWLWVNYSMDNTYSAMLQSEASAGTSTNERLITAKVLSHTIDEKIQPLENNILLNTQNGVKNYLPINSGATTGAQYVFDWVAKDIPAGQYIISFSTATASGAVAIEFSDSNTASYNRTGYRVITLPAQSAEVTIEANTHYVRLFANTALTITDIMLRPASISDSSYQPYAMSNAELTAAIQALQAQLANQ